ncbi:DUF2225 domain-containing protein [Andreesenia angusta]|nr:DUF2225 domain-containing protein [Andreesenia angusta]
MLKGDKMCIYKKKLECPVCKSKFETTKVKSSKLRVETMDTDLFKRFKDVEEHPIKYEVIMCPNCGYSAIEKHFENISKRGIAIIKENIMYKWIKQDYTDVRDKQDAIKAYKFALYEAELMKKSKVELGGICLRMAWVNRLYGDIENEYKYLDMTLKLYDKAYMEEDLMKEGADEITIGYLIGDINERLGNKKEALRWMNKIVFDRSISQNRTIEKLAREKIETLKSEDVEQEDELQAQAN